MKKISAISSNYATKGLLEKFVNNLLGAYENIEIILVDNDSPDGSADFVQEKFGNNPKVILIRAKNNGLAAGYNLGLQKATGDYYVFLGTDAFPTKDALEKMLEFMDEHADVGILTPKLYLRDGSVDIDAHRGFPTPWTALTHFTYLDKVFPRSKLFNGYSMGYLDFNTTQEIDACISHFMLVRPEVLHKVGKWDETFFLYGEDIDFCYRVKQVGYKIIYLGEVKVLHYKGAGVNRNTAQDIDNAMNTDFEKVSFKDQVIESKNVPSTSKWMRNKITKERTNAMRIFYKKHFMKKYPFLLTKLVLLGIWVNEKMNLAKIL